MNRVIRILVPTCLLFGTFAAGYFVGQNCRKARIYRFEDRQEFRARILEKMDSRLQLNDQQREQVEAILETKGKQFESLKEELKPRFRALHADGKEQIEAILNDEQREIFKTFRQYKGNWHHKPHDKDNSDSEHAH